MKNKIAIVLTGGTIGSATGAATIDLPKSGSIPLIERYREQFPNELDDYEIFTPINTLSENITADKLHTLLGFLTRLSAAEYGGILITHGSDTVHFTAAMAALLLSQKGIPIVVTCAMKPADQPGTDAFRNLHLALSAIRQQITGVWFAFQNQKGDPFLLNASRISPCTQSGEFFDFFASPAYYYKGGRFAANPEYKPTPPLCRSYTLPEVFQKVLFIRPYPLLDYRGFSLEGYDCVLHSGYHSATACCDGGNASILPFIKRCNERRIPFYFTLPTALEKPYGTTAQILASGAVPLYGVSDFAAYAHLLLKKTLRS